MNSLIVVPVVLPALTAALTLLTVKRRSLSSGLSLAGSVGSVLVAMLLFLAARDGTITAYALGNWPAPFGIVLVLDRLAALMVLLTALLALAVVSYAVLTKLDRRGWHFHPLFHFQLLGLNGAFLTGDLFNLFVFFEVLLIASYGLMLHGQGAARLAAGVQYVVINLIGSTLFLFAVGILYGVTGTLNMADMALRIPQLPESDQGLARIGALLLVAVFALKAALLPLHLWLPRTYASAAPAVAAMFAIMTKVGAYSIIRTVTLIFGGDGGDLAWLPMPWMLASALMTMILGFVGLLAAQELRTMAAFGLLGSMGTLLTAISLFEPQAMTAALYYLPHTTIAAALLFFVVDMIARRREAQGDAIAPGTPFAGMGKVAVLYMLAAIALVGMPPLSGFIGKLLILRATFDAHAIVWIWGAILGTTLIGVVGLARAGSAIFWKSMAHAGLPARREGFTTDILPALGLLVLLGALTAAAGPVTAYMADVSAQLFAPSGYIDAVLGPRGGN